MLTPLTHSPDLGVGAISPKISRGDLPKKYGKPIHCMGYATTVTVDPQTILRGLGQTDGQRQGRKLNGRYTDAERKRDQQQPQKHKHKAQRRTGNALRAVELHRRHRILEVVIVGQPRRCALRRWRRRVARIAIDIHIHIPALWGGGVKSQGVIGEERGAEGIRSCPRPPPPMAECCWGCRKMLPTNGRIVCVCEAAY